MTNNAQGYNNPPPDYNLYPLQPTPNAQTIPVIPVNNPSVAYVDTIGGTVSENIASLTPQQFLQQFPRVSANSKIQFTGTATPGDSVYVNIEHPIFPNIAILVGTVVSGSDTLETLAETIAGQINANNTFKAFGITASVATISSPIITLAWPGPLSALANVEAGSIVSGETCTVTSTSIVTADIIQMNIAGPGIAANSAQLTLNGTATQNDVLTVTVFNTALPSGQVQHALTVGATPTLQSAAAQIATALNADTALQAIGFISVAQFGSVFATWNSNYGPCSFGFSATRAAGTTLGLALVQAGPTGLQPTNVPYETITVGGTPAAGEKLTITLTQPNSFGNPVQVYVTVGGSPTTTSVAAQIVAAIQAQTTLAGAGFQASNLANVVTVTWPFNIGVIGFQAIAVGAPTETATIQTPLTSVQVAYKVVALDDNDAIATGLTAAINANVVLAGNLITATSSTNVITVQSNSMTGVLAYSSHVVGTGSYTLTFASLDSTDTATVGGSATQYDKLQLTFTDAELPGGAVVVTTLVTSGGMTTTQMATAIAANVNANAALADALVTASSSSNVVTFLYGPDAIVPVVTRAIVSATKTITVTGTPTPGDVLNVTVTNPDLYEGSLTLIYTVQAGDTTNTILAASIAAALNALTDFTSAGFVATGASNVVDVVYSGILPTTWSRVSSANTTLTLGNGSTTETISISQGNGGETFTITQFSGGEGPILPQQNFPFNCPNTQPGDTGPSATVQFYANQPVFVDALTLANLSAAKAPIV